jgi:creatinine amidohydrolase
MKLVLDLVLVQRSCEKAIVDSKFTHFRLSDSTAPAFAESVSGNPVILLPLGSHEDHGPHLPMGDYLLTEEMAGRIARRANGLGVKTFIAPGLPFGVSDYFGSSPGGLALSASTFRAVLSDLIAGLRRHGLTKIIILNGHGGNVPVIHEVTLQIRLGTGMVIPSVYLWKLARRFMETRLGPGHQARFGHGAEPLLSVTKAIFGDRVFSAEPATANARQMLGLPATEFGELDFQGMPIGVPLEFDQVPRVATTSAWPLADAALGQRVAEDLVGLATDFIVHYNQFPG